MDRHVLKNRHAEATIKAKGAELCSLKDAQGHEYLWQAGPAWPRHAPNLFPIVGKLKGDTLTHRGQSYHMTQHGFARDRAFAWEGHDSATCRLSLSDDEQTRAQYPFPFRFSVSYALEDACLSITYEIANTGVETLPASIGAHPAFGWPLQHGVAREDHRLIFDKAEPAPVRRLKNGLLPDDRYPSPVDGNILNLNDDLFTADALILDQPASRSVRFEANGKALEVSWDEEFREMGVWSKPGADFLCIEPWRGMASPEDFNGDFADKPGLMLIPPGEARRLTWAIRLFP